MSNKAARRYANAFLQTAIESNRLEECREDMLFIKETIEDSKELQLFLKSPIVKKEKKKAVLDEIFQEELNDLTIKLIEILSQKDREDMLEKVTAKFVELYNRHQGIIEVGITSAMKLDSEQMKELTGKLEKTTGKTVNVRESINEDLIGGLKVRIEDTVIDGTVKYKLNQLKDRLTSVAAD